MRFLKISLITLSSLLILMLWSGNCRSEDTELYAFPLEDVQRVLKNDQENEILKQRVEAYKQTIENDRQRIANLEQQIELQKQLIDIEAKRAEATAQALKQMTEVADRAIKLAEVGKPKSNWQTYCIFGLAMLVAGLIIAL